VGLQVVEKFVKAVHLFELEIDKTHFHEYLMDEEFSLVEED